MAASANKIVIISALNGTFEQKGFAGIQELIPVVEVLEKLSAVCMICGEDANFSYRLDTNSTEEVQIGGSESYMPLCR